MGARRYGLRDDQWERMERMLPGRKGSVGRPAQDNRLFVEAVPIVIEPGFRSGTCRNALAIFGGAYPVQPLGQTGRREETVRASGQRCG